MKIMILDSNKPDPEVTVFFGGTELVTYRVDLLRPNQSTDKTIGLDNNITFDSDDEFPTDMAAADLVGWYIATDAIIEPPGSGGTVDSYYARIGITQGGQPVKGSPAIWKGALNGGSVDSKYFAIKLR